MLATTESSGTDRRWTVPLLLTLGLALFLHGRAGSPPGDFRNADVAGMLYNADLLRSGELPYVESIDGKAPGTFFLVALVFETFGRSVGALWNVYLVWMLLGAWAVWTAARHLYGEDARTHCAFATAMYLASAGQFGLNYSSWMTPAYAWAFAAAIAGLRTGRRSWHVAAGVFAITAFLLKRQAVVLVPLFPVLFVWARRRGEPGAQASTWGWWSLAALLGAGPLLVVYGSEGHLHVLMRSLFPLDAIREYAGMTSPMPLAELGARVALQCWEAFPLVVALSVASVVVAAAERRGPPVLPQLALVALSVAAGNLGGPRFYSHYLVQDLPGLALLGARPGLGAFLRAAVARGWMRRAVTTAVVALALASLARHAVEYATGESSRRAPIDLTDARLAGEHVRRRTAPDDTIFVWGWSAWTTYFWADRRAPVNGYKSLGLLTDPNTNSTFFRSRPIALRKNVHSENLLRAFEERPPAYFVYSPYYTKRLKLEEDPLFLWEELVAVLERDYEREIRFGDVHVFRHREHTPAR